ncbi:MAG: DEAD/DEAH box helicase [Chloroflexi bacterium]|nr:DEAD/DEAH box helicase [Chloroflexota bacterium]
MASFSGDASPGAAPRDEASPAPSRDGAQRAVVLRLRGNDLLIQPADGAGGPAGAEALRRPLAAAARGAALVYDRRLESFRTPAGRYRDVRERLESDRYVVRTEFEPVTPLPFTPRLAHELRPYQRDALDAWSAAGRRGVVVLPTGSGKTLVALAAAAQVAAWTVVVVPTLDLLAQWRRALVHVLGAPPDHVGVFGGGKQELAPLTVITYDSAAIHTRALNRFALVVFDEVHHLPAPSYRLAAEGAVAPYRLGLSATPERTDGLESDLARLVGPIVYARTPDDLRAHLAAFDERVVRIALDAAERSRYEGLIREYREFIRKRRLRITSPEDFQRLVIWPSAGDPEARAAMLAHREARRIAFNAAGKLRAVTTLLDRHRDDRVLIFTEFNSVAGEISRGLLVPSITHRTPAAEREAILDGFRTGRFTKLVTGRVLNEGVDVPDANVAIVISGSGTRREYVQRLGRILRPKSGRAILYEFVTDDTSEVHLTRRRHGEEAGNGTADERRFAIPNHAVPAD